MVARCPSVEVGMYCPICSFEPPENKNNIIIKKPLNVSLKRMNKNQLNR